MKLFALFCVLTLLLDFASHAEGHDSGRVALSRELLLSLQTSTAGIVPVNIPMELRRQTKKSSHGKQGRTGGVQRRLKTLRLDNRCRRPPLPSILLSNVQSIRHKIDELETYAKLKREVKDTCLLVFTETWRGDMDQDSDLILTGFGSPIRMDRSPEITGKSRGGRVCFCVNQRYCNIVITERICTTDVELLSISLRSFYLPQQLWCTFTREPTRQLFPS